MERRDEERADLTRRAMRCLEHAADLEPQETVRRLRPEFRLWEFPSFQEWRSWTVFTSRPWDDATEAAAVREVTWDQPADYHRLGEPMAGLKYGFHTRPTISLRDASVPGADLAKHLAAAAEISMPLVGFEDLLALDGVEFGLENYNSRGSVRLEWLYDGPDEWCRIVTWAAQVRQFLCCCLDGSAPGG